MSTNKHFLYFAILYISVISLLSAVFDQNPSSDKDIYLFLTKHWIPFDQEMLTTFGQYPLLLPAILKAFSLTGLMKYEYGINYILSLYLLISIFLLRTRLTNVEQYIILAVGIPISAIWAQDETLSIPILIYFIRYTTNSDMIKTILIGLTMVSLKIFFIFFGISLLLSKLRWKSIKSLCVITMILCVAAFISINNIIIAGYNPNNDFAFGFFSILTKLNLVHYSYQNKVSIILFFVLSILLLINYYIRLTRGVVVQEKIYYTFMLLFLITNSHINPEYLIFVAIPAVLFNEQIFLSLIVYSAAWFQNVMNYAYRQTEYIEFLAADVALCLVGSCILIYNLFQSIVRN